MRKVKLGRVCFINRGDYNTNLNYEKLDIVKYNGKIFIAKKTTPVGNIPVGDVTDEYWQLIANSGIYVPDIVDGILS